MFEKDLVHNQDPDDGWPHGMIDSFLMLIDPEYRYPNHVLKCSAQIREATASITHTQSRNLHVWVPFGLACKTGHTRSLFLSLIFLLTSKERRRALPPFITHRAGLWDVQLK